MHEQREEGHHHMPPPTHRTTASVLRMRSTAALGDNIIGRLPYGTPLLRLSGPQGDWLRVQATLRDGTLEGWVNKYHVEAIPGAPPVDEPAWIAIARAEIGVQEYPGAQHNPRIIEYLRSTTNPATSDETPWCSGFVNWCMRQAGKTGTNSAAARSWLNWGRPLTAPEYGCVVVFDRSDPTNPNAGHVGFYLETRGTGYQVLGGNQSNKVCVAGYGARRVLGYRWEV